MSRYRLRQGKLHEHPEGEWVPWAEVKRLRADAAVVAFLNRHDIEVNVVQTADGETIVTVEQWAGHFEGSGDNVISAARMAMHMERKYKAAEAAGGKS